MDYMIGARRILRVATSHFVDLTKRSFDPSAAGSARAPAIGVGTAEPGDLVVEMARYPEQTFAGYSYVSGKCVQTTILGDSVPETPDLFTDAKVQRCELAAKLISIPHGFLSLPDWTDGMLQAVLTIGYGDADLYLISQRLCFADDLPPHEYDETVVSVVSIIHSVLQIAHRCSSDRYCPTAVIAGRFVHPGGGATFCAIPPCFGSQGFSITMFQHALLETAAAGLSPVIPTLKPDVDIRSLSQHILEYEMSRQRKGGMDDN